MMTRRRTPFKEVVNPRRHPKMNQLEMVCHHYKKCVVF
jgi:hypothetical protein